MSSPVAARAWLPGLMAATGLGEPRPAAVARWATRRERRVAPSAGCREGQVEAGTAWLSIGACRVVTNPPPTHHFHPPPPPPKKEQGQPPMQKCHAIQAA